VFRAAQQLNYTYENEPPPLLIELDGLLVIRSRRARIGRMSKSLQLRSRRPLEQHRGDDADRAIADNVVAARQPGVHWRVFLAPPGAPLEAPGAFFVGNLTLFGHGIRGGHHFQPASFTFVAEGAVKRALAQGGSSLVLTLVPAGVLVDGKPTTPRPRSEVRIQRVTFLVETTTRR
jgi:hypothetical protein